MGLQLDAINIDAHDARGLGEWWAALLGWDLVIDEDGDVIVGREGVELAFYEVPDEKVVKNRIHLDLRPDDHAAEVARAIELGATRVDVGQGEQSWEVLADPEGNEFCILRSLPSSSS